MRQPFVAGNWKMHGSLADNESLLQAIAATAPTQGVTIAVCPPFVYLAQVQSLLGETHLAWGAQNVSQAAVGAFTGEIAVSMLQELGCRYVIVGHSERRQLYAETDGLVAEKFAAAQSVDLVPILCVGETLADREADNTYAVVQRQLDAVLTMQGIQAFAKAVIAYEPVWAIGTGKTATPAQAQAVHEFIRQHLAQHAAPIAEQVQILYGGSVKANNASELFAMPDIDGGLIGGAALKAADFVAICQAAV